MSWYVYYVCKYTYDRWPLLSIWDIWNLSNHRWVASAAILSTARPGSRSTWLFAEWVHSKKKDKAVQVKSEAKKQEPKTHILFLKNQMKPATFAEDVDM